MKRLIADLACGYLPEHTSDEESIGLDLNFEHGKPKVAFPIIGSVTNIPLRDNVIDHEFGRDILEHLDNPSDMLKEMNRTLKPSGTVYIRIPVESNLVRQQFKRIFLDFPFGLITAFKMCVKSERIWKKHKGMLHLWTITPRYIGHYFKITNLYIHRQPRLWWSYFFHSKDFKPLQRIFRKLGFKLTRAFRTNLYSVWVIEGVNK